MTFDEKDDKIYWQVGDGEKHAIPDGATLYVKKPSGKGFFSFAIDSDGDVVVGTNRRKIPAALMKIINLGG